MIFGAIEMAAIAGFPVAMVSAAASDLLRYVVPNWVSVVVAALFAVSAVASSMDVQVAFWHLGVGAAVLLIGWLFFLAKAMGGADVKLMSAAAVWFGPALVLHFLLITFVLGGVLTLAILAFRRLPMSETVLRREWVRRLHDRDAGIPFCVAIGGGAIVVFPKIPAVATVLSPLAAGG